LAGFRGGELLFWGLLGLDGLVLERLVFETGELFEGALLEDFAVGQHDD
jgi:hypothetical protein